MPNQIEVFNRNEKCRDYGDPDVPECEGTPDPNYTMDYTDVNPGPEGYIYWCAKCGERARQIETVLLEALKVPKVREGFEAALEKAEKARS